MMWSPTKVPQYSLENRCFGRGQSGPSHLERLVAHKDVAVQREAELPPLEEARVRLRQLAVCMRAEQLKSASGPCTA